MMSVSRRGWLRGTAAASFALAGAAHARNEAFADLGGTPLPSTAIALELPAVADNGAFVPVTVATSLADAREIVLVVDSNPEPIAARFALPEGTEAFVATRIKMAASGTVYAAVRTADGRLHAAARAVEVVRGGCG